MTKYLLILLLLIIPVSAYAYNSGFTPIYQPNLPSSGAINNTLSSVSHAESIVSGQVLNDHQFKGIGCGGDLLCSSNNTDVTVSYTGSPGSGEANTASNVGLGHGLFKQKSGVNLEFLNIFCAGDILCSINSTDVRISYTATPMGSSALDDLTDVIITSPALFSTLFYNGVEWIDKVFSINSITCGAGQFVNSINNQTGVTACGSPTGSGFTNIASSPQTTATILASNQSNSATIKTLTQGQGITLTNGSQAVTVATNFKVNNIDIDCTDSQQLNRLQFSNTTGTFTGTCDTDETGGGGSPRGGYLVGMWTQSSTKTNIGTAFVDVYTQANSNGKAVYIDTDAFTTMRIQIEWNKIGGGTQTCQVITTGAVVAISTDVVSGTNDSGFDAIPAGLLNAENNYKIQCKSTTAADDPIFESASIWVK